MSTSLTPMDRFNKFVTRKPGCWGWKGCKNENGYACLGEAGRPRLAHRIAYKLFRGRIPDGACVLHRCDTPECTRPSHLFIGTHDDNMKDMAAKKRSTHGEKSTNAKLTSRQVLAIRKRAAAGELPKALAVKFGVVPQQIYKILNRHQWKHI